MTLIQPPLMVTGGTHPARSMRMMIRDLSHGSQGITEGDDLRVSPTTTPGPGVRVGTGSAVVAGATWGQGSYTQYNNGDQVVPIAPTGGTGRTDLLCLRVEDPEFEGSRDPGRDDIGYFHVIPGVSATTTAPPAGMSAIPLARITQPPNCATITASMITDLRKVANPRRERKLSTIIGFPYTVLPAQWGVWQDNWPPNATAQIDIPTWATKANLIATLTGIRVMGETFFGLRLKWGAWISREFQVDTDTITYASKYTAMVADNPDITAAMRGTRQELRLQGGRYNNANGNADVADGTALIFDVEFVESAY
ncbi:hypothetical protein GCM10009759_03450 [Kitasatospora saccharophila]|uniref:Uncharacterized protein n=1 Tax=Kitasatospora saccharophila TaxID=407973 RepID=A0ABN2W892_9ACTN